MSTSEILDRTPPHDLAAEIGVVGSLLLDPTCLDDIGRLHADDFHGHAARTLYSCLVKMITEGKPTNDVTLVSGELRDAGNWDSVGGAAFLAQVATNVPHPAHASHYADRVRRCSQYRQMIRMAIDLIRDAYTASADPEDLLNSAEAALSAIETGDYSGNPIHFSEAVTEALQRIAEIAERKKGAGLMTGIYTYDQDVGGLFPGEFSILAARPRIGKTSLATQIAHYVASRGKRVYFASLEMSGAEVATRLLCGLAEVSNQKIRTGRITSDDVSRLAEVSNSAARGDMFIHDRAGLSCQDITRAARRVAREGLGLVVVDYLQRITPRDRRVQRYEQIGEMARSLKELARELRVPVLCLAQLGRSAEGRDRPALSDLRESGDIEAEADTVTFLHRTGEESNGVFPVAWIIEKNRNGAAGDITLEFRSAGTTFYDPQRPVQREEFTPYAGSQQEPF